MTTGNSNAFPIPGLQNNPSYNGLTVRDYFAAKAMAALISTAGGPCIVGALSGVEDETAKGAYKIADAMVAARDG